MISVSTASSELTDWWGEGIPVLKMSDQVGDLSPLHVVVAPIEAIVGRGEGI